MFDERRTIAYDGFVKTVKQLPHPTPCEITLNGVLAALSEPVRLRIVRVLADGEEHQWGAFDVGVALSTLSHHVRVLREAGIINHRKAGTRCYLMLRPDLETVFPGLLGSILKHAEAEQTQPSRKPQTAGEAASR